jgi:signal transduction histidine kinase
MIANRLSLRRRLLLSVTGALAIALVVLIGAFNVVLHERLGHEASSALAARASAALASLHVVGGTLAAPEAPDAAAPDTQAWVFAGRHLLEQPPADPALQHAAQRISGGRGTQDPPGTHARLYAVPVVADGRRLGTVVTAISLTPYQNTAQTALIASLVLGAFLLAAAALAARVLISAALRPVADMTAQAAAWSRIDSGQRFQLGPPRDELTALAVTLDGLLDRVATSLRHEQRFSAELSHELRSPLASVIAEAQLALGHTRPPDQQRAGYERILAAAQRMRRTLDTLLTAARIEHRASPASGDAAAAAHAAARGCDAAAADSGITITVKDPPARIRVGVETEVAERVLAPLIENACHYGASSVAVALQQRNGAVVFTVQDDGPGVPEQDRERIFEPGWRNGAGRGANDQGAGLGLPLARRLARAAGGDVYLEPGRPGGRFAARLPPG